MEMVFEAKLAGQDEDEAEEEAKEDEEGHYHLLPLVKVSILRIQI